MLGETEKSSDVCRTASLSEMGHERERQRVPQWRTRDGKTSLSVQSTTSASSTVLSVRSSHQTVSDYTLIGQRFPNTQQSRFLIAKLVLPSISDTSHSSLKLAELSNNSLFWMKNVTFLGSKHTVTPPTYFQGSRPITPKMYAPASDIIKSTLLLPLTPQ